MACALHRSRSAALELVQLVDRDIEHVDICVCTLESNCTVVVSYVVRICAVRYGSTLCGSQLRAQLSERCKRGIKVDAALYVCTVDRTGNASGNSSACALLVVEISYIIVSAYSENSFAVARVNVVHCGLIVITLEEHVVVACDAENILERGAEIFVFVSARVVSGIAVICGRGNIECRAGERRRKNECGKSLA